MKTLQFLIAVITIACALVLPVKALTDSLPVESHGAGSLVRPSAALFRDQQQAQGGDAEGFFQTALALYRQHKYDEALTNCLKAASLNPNDYRPHALAGYVYMAQRKLKSASEAFADAIRLEPHLKEIYLAKADADYLRNAHADAVLACRKAIEVDPNYAVAYAKLGNLLKFDKEHQPEAITVLRSAIRLDPKLTQPYDDLGSILESAKDEKGAEEVFRQGMAADPKHMGGRFVLGRMMVNQGRLAEARELWNGRTSDEDRSYPQFIELLQRAENLKSANEALAKTPHDPDALVAMGMAVMDGESWVVDGRQKRALVYFKEALKIKPNFAKAQYGICKAFIQGVEFSKDERKTVDLELAKLRKLDPSLADEMEGYRKNYSPGLVGVPADPNR
jgi:tetratricopeptide (TPR) repeat protein